MDIKTLEYLEERAKKGRRIVGVIEHLKKHVEMVKGNGFMCIDINIGSDKLRLTEWGPKQAPNTYATQIEALMVNVYIDAAHEEIKRLEQELSEL